MGNLRRASGGAGGDGRLFWPALIEVVFRQWFRLGGIERGALIEVVGERFLGGLFLFPPPGCHGELGLGWPPCRMEEWG